MNSEIRYKFSKLMDNIGSGFYTDALYDKADFTLSFFGFFSNNKTPEILHAEAAKLNALLPTLRAFERLLQTLEGSGEKSIHWDPQLSAELSVQTLTLSPTLQMNKDDSQLLGAIESMRKELTDKPVRYDILINYIIKRAKEEGYLEVGVEEHLERTRY
jgi:hypothetical protein